MLIFQHLPTKSLYMFSVQSYFTLQPVLCEIQAIFEKFGFWFCSVLFSNQQTANETQTESLSSSPNAMSPVPLNNPTGAPRFGTVTPNRIFVGGIDFKVFSFLILLLTGIL